MEALACHLHHLHSINTSHLFSLTPELIPSPNLHQLMNLATTRLTHLLCNYLIPPTANTARNDEDPARPALPSKAQSLPASLAPRSRNLSCSTTYPRPPQSAGSCAQPRNRKGTLLDCHQDQTATRDDVSGHPTRCHPATTVQTARCDQRLFAQQRGTEQSLDLEVMDKHP